MRARAIVTSMGVIVVSCFCSLSTSVSAFAQGNPAGFLPGQRVLVESHNCYPYMGKWTDRLQRGLSTGYPVAIEIDLAPRADGTLVVAHALRETEKAPTPRDYFFEVVRPVMEQALKEGNKGDWPLITLNVNDIRTESVVPHEEFWNLLKQYQPWLSTAPKSADAGEVTPVKPGPLMILTNSSPNAMDVFYARVPVGEPLLAFGVAEESKATNYKRWQNHAWKAVEPEGQPKAGDWSDADAKRLKDLVQQAHAGGLWIRFYALDGFERAQNQGWGLGYNFGSLEAVQTRWKAAIDAGVDFIATDQCEDFAKFRKK